MSSPQLTSGYHSENLQLTTELDMLRAQLLTTEEDSLPPEPSLRRMIRKQSADLDAHADE